MPDHTSDTLALIGRALHGVARTWREPDPARPSWRYSKAGVITNDLALLSHSPRALMAAIDTCNARFCRSAVVPARAGLVERRGWNTKFEMRTPRCTTQINELPVAQA